jgi:hypothetical protein
MVNGTIPKEECMKKLGVIMMAMVMMLEFTLTVYAAGAAQTFDRSLGIARIMQTQRAVSGKIGIANGSIAKQAIAAKVNNAGLQTGLNRVSNRDVSTSRTYLDNSTKAAIANYNWYLDNNKINPLQGQALAKAVVDNYVRAANNILNSGRADALDTRAVATRDAQYISDQKKTGQTKR